MPMKSTMPTLYYCEASYKQQKIKTKNSDFTKARLARPYIGRRGVMMLLLPALLSLGKYTVLLVIYRTNVNDN